MPLGILIDFVRIILWLETVVELPAHRVVVVVVAVAA